MKRRLLAILLAMSMLFTLLPGNVAMADGGDSGTGPVAQVVEKDGTVVEQYTDFDDAVKAVTGEQSVELLKSCETDEGIFLQNGRPDREKDLTVKAAKELTEKPTLTFTKYGIALWGGHKITFDGIKIVMKGIHSTPFTEENWDTYVICTQPHANIILNKVDMTMDGNDESGNMVGLQAIYLDESNLTLTESTLAIRNYKNSALSWNGGTSGYKVKMEKSHYIAENTYSGIVGTFNFETKDSIVDVNNNRGNGSNGSNFYFTDSVVNFNDNGSHGLSAGKLSIKNSKVTANHNGLCGVHVGGGMDMDGTSALTIQENCYKQDADISALRIWSGRGKYSAEIKSGAVVDISNNKASGIETYANTTFEEGVDLNVRNNILTRIKGDVDGHGGGIFSDGRKITLPSDAKIYNNHAISAGDDLYSTGTITFGQTGEDWILDDCDHAIDNWYHDGENARWSAHNSPINVDPFTEAYNENNLATVNGPLALKAAHDLIPLGPDESDWAFSKSKSATNLETNAEGKYESDVTLSLPSEQESLATDVVFVFDESSCSAPVKEEVGNMLEALYAQVEETGANVKVGAVQFRGETTTFDLSEINATTQESLNEFLGNRPKTSGSNMSMGLLAGEKMLDADQDVADSRKYLILVSDGITYIWDDETTPAQENMGVNFSNADTPNKPFLAGPDGWDVKHGQKFVPADWNAHFSSEFKTLMDTTIAKKASPYVRGADISGNPFVTPTEKDNYLSTVDIALYKSKLAYDSIASKYHAYAVDMGVESEMATYPYGPSFMKYLANGEEVSFDNIQNDILYLLDAGSTVVDEIGAGTDNHGNAYNMDFVPQEDKLTLTVGKEELTTKEVEPTLAHETARFVFERAEARPLSSYERDYPFVLHYYQKGQDGASDECFVWDINVPVSNFAPVQLTYAVQLMNPQTAPGTYGEYDQFGEGATDGLFTNNSALLCPIDSNENKGIPEYFRKPTVSYNVAAPTPTPTPTPNPNPIPIDPAGPEDLNTVDHYSYIVGYPDGTVRPEGKITRGEVATIFFRLLTDEARNEGWSQTNNFSDVPADTWYSNAISTLTNMGVLSGYKDGTFRPNAPITRAEYATIAVSFYKETVKDYQGTFSDVPQGQWYTQYVETAAALGLISGYPDGTFAPNKNISRAEACTITNQTLNRKPCKDHLLPVEEMINWPDNQPDAWYYYDMQEATNSHDYEWDGDKEKWTTKLSQRDWVQLEKEWSEANSATGGGEVKDENK